MRTPPGPGAGEFEWLAFRQRGVITTAQAERFHKPGAVRGHVKQGRWRRLCRGVLLIENGQLNHEQQLWVAALVAGPGAHLAGWTAATEGGVRGLRTEPITVIVPVGRCRSVRLPRLPDDMVAVQIHRTTILPPSHRRPAGPPRTIVARAAVDGAAWAAHDNEARELIVRAWQQGRVTVWQLREAVRWFPALRRRRLILQTIADCEGGATALSEIDLVRLCRRYRIPMPDLQRPGSMPPGGGATSTRTGRAHASWSRSTEATTATRLSGPPTCSGRTTSGSRATASSDSRRGSCAQIPPRWPGNSARRSPRRATPRSPTDQRRVRVSNDEFRRAARSNSSTPAARRARATRVVRGGAGGMTCSTRTE